MVSVVSQEPESPGTSLSSEPSDLVLQTNLPEEASPTTHPKPGLHGRSKSYSSLFGFFETKDEKPFAKNKSLSRSESDGTLAARDPISDDIIQGLA